MEVINQEDGKEGEATEGVGGGSNLCAWNCCSVTPESSALENGRRISVSQNP